MRNEFLTKRSIKAGSWLFGYNTLARTVGLVKTGVIARILTPAQFGVFGVATLALSLLETFSETGVEQALIQKKQLKESDVASAYMVSIFRGLAIGLLLFLSAPLAGSFFGSPDSVLFIRVISLSPIIRNLRNPYMSHFRRRLEYKQDFAMRTAGTLVELIVGVTVALLTRSAWGLVAANVAGAVTETIVSYLVSPRFDFKKYKKSTIKSLLSFGGWLWGGSVLSYILNEGDDIVVGKMLGVTSLGYYQNAYKIASLPATQVTGVVSEVSFPAFSSIQQDKDRLKRAYKKTLGSTLLITGIMTVFIFIFAKQLTLLVLGDQWLPLVPALKVLTIFGGIRSIYSIVGSVFKAVGKPEIILITQFVRLVFLSVLIVPFVGANGIVGASWAVVLSSLVVLPYSFWQVKVVLRQL